MLVRSTRSLLLHAFLSIAAPGVIWAQESHLLRADIRRVWRGIELGNGDTVRKRLWNTPARGATNALQNATLERLAFRTEEAERSYRALLGESIAVRAHAAFGLGSLFSQAGRNGDAATWLDSAFRSFVAIGDSAGQAEALTSLGVAISRTRGVPASREILARAERLLPAYDDWTRAFLLCNQLQMRVRAAERIVVADFHAARQIAQRVSARAEGLCLFAQLELLSGNGQPEAALATIDTLIALQRRASLTTGLAAARQWQGVILLSQGNYRQARQALDEAIRLGDMTGNLGSGGWSYTSLADIAQRVGSWEDGVRYARLAERHLGRMNDRPASVFAAAQAATLTLAAGNVERASRQLASLQHELLAVYPRMSAPVLSTRSDIARRLDDAASARILLDSAAMFVEAQDLADWRPEITYRRAMLDFSAGRMTEARRALSLVQQANPGLSPLLRYQLLARIAEIDAREGRLASAEDLLNQALREMDRWRNSLADRGLQLGASQTRAFDWDTDLGVATIIATIAQADPRAALDLADKRRARVLLDESMRRRMLVEGASGPASPFRDSTRAVSMPTRTVAPNTAIISYTTGSGGEPTTAFVITSVGVRAVVIPAADSMAGVVRTFIAFLEAGRLARPASRRLAGCSSIHSFHRSPRRSRDSSWFPTAAFIACRSPRWNSQRAHFSPSATKSSMRRRSPSR